MLVFITAHVSIRLCIMDEVITYRVSRFGLDTYCLTATSSTYPILTSQQVIGLWLCWT